MLTRKKAFALLLLSTFAAIQTAGSPGTAAYAASSGSTAAAAAKTVTEVSTLNGLSALKLGTTLQVKLSNVGIQSQTGGNILTYTLTYTNNAGSSVNLADYFSKIVTAGGSTLKGKPVSADSAVKKIPAKQSISLTYYANIGAAASVKGLKINLYGWNFSAANYEQRIGTFTIPANYSLSSLIGETRKVELGGITAGTTAESVQIYKYNGKVYAKVGLSLTNLGTKVLTDPGYAWYLKSSGGSVFTLALDDSSSEFKLQPQEKKTLYYMTEIPSYMNVSKLTLQIAKLDEGLKLYLPVSSYILPAAVTADFTVAAGYTKKVSVGSNHVDMQLLKASVHADNGNGVWSYQLRVKNTGSQAVTLPAYELNVQSAEGYSFPVTATAFDSLTLKPLEEKLIELSAKVPLELAQNSLELQMIAPAASADKITLPVAYFRIPYTPESQIHLASETGVTNTYGTFAVSLDSLLRLPWGSEDLVLAKLTIRNATSKSITLPPLTGVLLADQQDLSSSSQTYTDNSSSVLAPGASTQITVQGRIPYTLDVRQIKLILQETKGTEVSQFLSLSTSDSPVKSVAPLAAGEAFKITATGKQATVKERSTLLYTGTGSNLVYSEVEMNSDEVRQADLARLYAQFRTADGQFFEATVSQSELSTSPGGKTLVTFWAKVPATLDTAGLQLYVSQAIADGKLTAAGTAATGYVNTAALTLTPAEVTPMTNLASVPLFPYTLAVTSSTGELTKGANSIAVTFNYNLNQDTTYQTGAYQHKLILQIIDPYGQSHEKALTPGTDLTLGTNNSYSTTLSSVLFKNLSSGTYALKFYDEFQGVRTEIASQAYALEVTAKAAAATSSEGAAQ
ncbi:hypothetical protein [Paenibacillus piscarius]|uniref:hypothetical protein n=1 Tax=Paenibacillus piscarius TaxID=1089681 RepID=UPI001EE8BF98|nr:hypothetical protein [Paenibacillus piscarius]